jgi:hypothetical protein
MLFKRTYWAAAIGLIRPYGPHAKKINDDVVSIAQRASDLVRKGNFCDASRTLDAMGASQVHARARKDPLGKNKAMAVKTAIAFMQVGKKIRSVVQVEHVARVRLSPCSGR